MLKLGKLDRRFFLIYAQSALDKHLHKCLARSSDCQM